MYCSRRRMTTKMLIRRTAMMKRLTGFSKSKRSTITKSTSTSKTLRISKVSINHMMLRVSKQNSSHSLKLLTTHNNTVNSMLVKSSRPVNKITSPMVLS